MKTAEAQERPGAATTAPTRRRFAATAWAVVAAAAAWVAIEPIGGADLRAPAQGGSPGFDIGLPAVVLTSAAASLLAWGLLAALERWTRRPQAWTWLALGGFLVSLAGPMSGGGIPDAHRWLLALLHIVVAVVLIPQLRSTIRR